MKVSPSLWKGASFEDNFFDRGANLLCTHIRGDLSDSCAKARESHGPHDGRHGIARERAVSELLVLDEQEGGSRRQIRVHRVSKDHRDPHRGGGDDEGNARVVGRDMR